MNFIRLDLFRSEFGLTQKELASAIGLSQTAVSQLESGSVRYKRRHEIMLKYKWPDVDFSRYVYESNRYPADARRETIVEKKFPGDWSMAEPIRWIGDKGILFEYKRVSVAQKGYIIIDRYSEEHHNPARGHELISPKELANPYLLLRLTRYRWFDTEVYENFKRAYDMACLVAGIQKVKQHVR